MSKCIGFFELFVELKEKLGVIEVFINKYILVYLFDEKWWEWLGVFKEVMKLGCLIEDLEFCSEILVRVIVSYGYGVYFFVFVMVMVYVFEGMDVLMRGDLD